MSYQNAEKAWEGLQEQIRSSWLEKEVVLDKVLHFLKSCIYYPAGFGHGDSTRFTHDGEVTLAARLGLFLGQAETPEDFIEALCACDLSIWRIQK